MSRPDAEATGTSGQGDSGDGRRSHLRAESSEKPVSGLAPKRMPGEDELRDALREAGFRRAGFVRARSGDGRPDADGDVTACVVAVAYDTAEIPPPDDGREYARVGWFARRHFYRELVDALSEVARALAASTCLPPRAFRAKANSRFPEKALAVAAGLGAVGRNSLVIDEERGPGVALAALFLPFALATRPQVAAEPFSRCGSCDACVRACPTRALDGKGGLDRERCLQAWATREGSLPQAVDAAWRGLFYGCDECLRACPHFVAGARADILRARERPGRPRGELGAWMDRAGFLELDDEAARARLEGSALGFPWVSLEALRRNARHP